MFDIKSTSILGIVFIALAGAPLVDILSSMPAVAQGRNGLPPCNLDSFVYEAAGMADLIYGDEGTEGPPPFEEFTKEHRIQAGIWGRRAAGITTGHGSYLPDAWGGDEWVDGPEFSQSAPAAPYWAPPRYIVPPLAAPPASDETNWTPPNDDSALSQP